MLFLIALPFPSHSAPASPQLLAREGKGALYRQDGHRILVLAGTPEEMGRQHGTLLKDDIRALFARALPLVQPKGRLNLKRLFIPNIAKVRARCEPFIPDDHMLEMDALAEAAGLSRDEVRLANLLPEMFHCASFVMTGKATRDGELVHGRVLDYKRMNKLRLYDHALTFICLPQGKHPFVSVGYTGFVGVVTGMNAQKLAIGAMGGRQSGDWDGMPMTFLVRHILEEADALPGMLRIVQRTPRTCEYYFVVSDGKGRQALGLRYTAKRVELIGLGEEHPKLPNPIPDTIAISNPSRRGPLQKRIRAKYGTITTEDTLQMMTRPVSKEMNLHCAVFLPEALRMWAAHCADPAKAEKFQACHQPYLEIDLRDWLSIARKPVN